MRPNGLKSWPAWLAVLGLVSTLAAGCPGGRPTDETPEGALTLFLEAMIQGNGPRAVELLDPDAQRGLAERAAEASRQAGRTLEPADVLAVERFVTNWEIARMTTEETGDSAVVTATGSVEGQRAEVRMRRVEGRWRVVLPLDPPPR